MKKNYLVIFIILIGFSVDAQTLTIPDANLKEWLVGAGISNEIAKNSDGEYIIIDTNDDGEIQESEAQLVASLNIPAPYNITSIEGIQGFTNLTYLSLFGHQLVNADISGMVNLENADVSGTLEEINASGCINLQIIILSPQHTKLNVSGCSSLTFLTIGSNVTEFDIMECSSLETLNFSDASNFPILNLSGLGLTNLQSIGASGDTVDTLDAHDCTNLSNINVGNVSHLNLSNTGFTQLGLWWTNLESINVSGCLNLTKLFNTGFNASTPLLSDVNITGCTAMTQLDIKNTALSEIELTDLPVLEDINLSNCQFSQIDASELPSLDYLFLDGNLFTSFNPEGLDNLKFLRIRENQLTIANFSEMTSLEELDIMNNEITSLNIAGCTSLVTIEASNNNISNVDFSEASSLVYVYMGFNNLTSLNLNYNPSISWAVVNDNPQLESLYLKNGGNSMNQLYAANCDMLEYVCADDQDFELLNTYFDNNSMEVTVDSTCSVEPTENFNSITGIIRFDDNNNGCDSSDNIFADMKFSVQRDGEEAFIFSNTEGNYIAYAIEGIETVVLTPEIDSDLFIITPASATETFAGTGNTITADFCITPNGIHPDLDVVILPIFDARPGFDATYQLIVSNKGNQLQSGSVTLAFNDAVIDFTTASLATTSSNIGNLTWDFTNLAPFNTIIIDLTFNVNTPQEEPAVNVGDILPFTASITTIETDDTPEDNIYKFNQIVIGAIDPNDKQVAEGTAITPDQTGEYLHYLIRFQNTGTAEAINIKVKDVLADNLDWDTFQPISASHEYRATLTEGNIAEFFFDNIWLPAEEDNEPESHGFVSFKIKPVAGAVLGDTFENTAEIYFDFESAIITNTVVTSVEETAGIDGVENSFFMLYPNPTKDMVYITPKQEIAIESITIYNLLGQEIITVKRDNTVDAITVNVAGLQAGHYLIEVKTEKGRAVKKLIKH